MLIVEEEGTWKVQTEPGEQKRIRVSVGSVRSPITLTQDQALRLARALEMASDYATHA